ncbi:MAG TPA: S26 family signal peptidase [Methanolinea sp.]|nr:S26 family signal peptidase [Methanolinea sp.]
MPEPPLLRHKRYDADEIALSSAALLELLMAVHEKGADFRFRATGTSMYPTIRDGDIITVSPLGGIKPGVYEVVAFRHPGNGKLVVHRVLALSPDSFVAGGDNSQSDGTIPCSHLLGVVTKVERNGSPLFWPDKRRYPFLAKVYFQTGYWYITVRKRGYGMVLKLFRKRSGETIP